MWKMITEVKPYLKENTIKEWQINIRPKLKYRRVLLPKRMIKTMGIIEPRALATPTRNVPNLGSIAASAKICDEYKLTTHMPLNWLKSCRTKESQLMRMIKLQNPTQVAFLYYGSLIASPNV
jgi:hypothetical protein